MLRSILYLAIASAHSVETYAASPYQSSSRDRRDDSSSSPKINTTIFSANGTDVSNSFQIMIYDQSKETTDGLSDRQVSLSREIACESPTAHTISSFCKYQSSSRGHFGLATLKEYVVHCQYPPAGPFISYYGDGPHVHNWPQPRLSVREEGACAEGEICVDDFYRYLTAYCVSTEHFVRLIQRGKKQNSTTETDIGELENKTARMIISQEDKSTPLEVQAIDLKAGVTGRTNTDGTTVQERKCRYCCELRTQKMAEGTDFLQTEASLMTAATVVAGVVWLVISG